ncbi:1-aminocyclopropane-1-carboxylate oxidase homolog 1 [Linum perenne]
MGYAYHYYPPCPQPELALGCVHHTDIDFLTVILQDQVGGLQVLRHNSWIDVPYVPGALVLISNDKFISALHRVRAKNAGPRISIATFFGHGSTKSTRLYGPIKELVSEKDPPKYKEITIRDFFLASYEKGVDGTSVLPRLKHQERKKQTQREYKKMVATTVAAEGYDRMAELKAFDESKAGVKGLVDSGITEIPKIFHAPQRFLDKGSPFSPEDPDYIFPIIDLSMVHDPTKRKQTVAQIRNAAKSWGFFLIVNHGVPKKIQDEMTTGIQEFFEQDVEQKKEFYNKESIAKKVVYSSNPDMYTIPVCSWTDLMLTHVTPEAPKPEELPEPCKEIVPIYTSEMNKLGELLFELLSEGLGLESGRLKDMGCLEAVGFALHYYPACPQPELAIGFVEHTDIDFLTVILQDEIGGLQVKHHNSWIDVPCLPGAMVVNIGDMLQVIINKGIVFRTGFRYT